jgi:hypothetical protein
MATILIVGFWIAFGTIVMETDRSRPPIIFGVMER